MKPVDVVNALLKHENMIDTTDYDYTENEFRYFVTIGSKEYNIFTEKQREKEVKEYILDTIEYFRPDFLSTITGIDYDAFEGVSELRNANKLVMAIVKGTCGIDKFVEEAVDSDGYGHFLSPYDGREIELVVNDGWERHVFYAYRVN